MAETNSNKPLSSSRHRFRYGSEIIQFTLRRQPEREVQRLAIHVEPDGRVLVDAPVDVDTAIAIAAVKKRARWIHQQLAAVTQRLAHVLPREYVSGESLMYVGRRYRLRIVIEVDRPPGACMRGAYIEVNAPNRSREIIRATLESWYRSRAKEVFANRLARIAEPLRWIKVLPSMRLQAMKVQWGSCSPSGRLTLNPNLVKAPRECIDYVLLHELCHLQHHNHSKKFYAALDKHMPGWRLVKERLDNMAESVLNV